MAYAMAITERPKAAAVANKPAVVPQPTNIAVAQPRNVRTNVPMHSAMYFFIILNN